MVIRLERCFWILYVGKEDSVRSGEIREVRERGFIGSELQWVRSLRGRWIVRKWSILRGAGVRVVVRYSAVAPSE